MCTGRTHAMQGAIAGLAAPALFPTIFGYAPTVPAILLGAMLSAGGALLPDLDTPSSTASGSFGPLTDAVSDGIRALSRTAFVLTATPADRLRTKGTHRGLTHTLVFAGVVSAAFTALAAFGLPAVLGIVFVLSFLGLRGLPPTEKNLTDAVTALGITGATWALLAGTGTTLPAWWVGGAIGVGCVAHILGDAFTDKNVPLMAPLPLFGQNWRPLGTPKLLSFTTDGRFEHGPVLWANTTALCVLLVNLTPGGHEGFTAMLHHAGTT